MILQETIRPHLINPALLNAVFGVGPI